MIFYIFLIVCGIVNVAEGKKIQKSNTFRRRNREVKRMSLINPNILEVLIYLQE